MYEPITRRQILDSSKLKEFADDNFKFDENGRKLSKQVENTVGKGEIACYEQFLLFPQCFQKTCFPEVSKGVIVWKWVKVVIQLSINCSQLFKDYLPLNLDIFCWIDCLCPNTGGNINSLPFNPEF